MLLSVTMLPFFTIVLLIGAVALVGYRCAREDDVHALKEAAESKLLPAAKRRFAAFNKVATTLAEAGGTVTQNPDGSITVTRVETRDEPPTSSDVTLVMSTPSRRSPR